MPIYDLYCGCGFKDSDRMVWPTQDLPDCPDCNQQLKANPASNVMVKVKGEGGYPSRRRQVFNTTARDHPPLEKDIRRKIYGSS